MVNKRLDELDELTDIDPENDFIYVEDASETNLDNKGKRAKVNISYI